MEQRRSVKVGLPRFLCRTVRSTRCLPGLFTFGADVSLDGMDLFTSMLDSAWYQVTVGILFHPVIGNLVRELQPVGACTICSFGAHIDLPTRLDLFSQTGFNISDVAFVDSAIHGNEILTRKFSTVSGGGGAAEGMSYEMASIFSSGIG